MMRHRRRVAHARSNAERIAMSERLQTEAMRAIHGDPMTYESFMSRNYHRRRADRVPQLLVELARRKPVVVPRVTPEQLMMMQQMQQRGGGQPAAVEKKSEVSIVANTRQNSVIIRAPADRVAIATARCGRGR